MLNMSNDLGLQHLPVIQVSSHWSLSVSMLPIQGMLTQPCQIYVKRRSCTDVNSPHKRKC
jgi:hypothetical protein